MSPFTILALLLTLAALSSYANHRFIGLPNTAALTLFSLLLSLGFIAASHFGLPFQMNLVDVLNQVNLSQSLLGGVLSFLLFAAAMNVELRELHVQRWRVLSLTVVTTLLSVGIVAALAYGIFRWLGLGIPLLYCLLFGALISPTDPVAVLDLLKNVNTPRALETKIAGESLFNDGAGVVVFVFFLESLLATGPKLDLDWHRALELLVVEAGGGVGLGLLLGGVAFVFLRSVDDYRVETLITLALASGGYALATAWHTSGPLVVATSGILVGSLGRKYAMSETTRRNLDTFWELIDEVLNALLFAVVGLQVVALKFQPGYLGAAALMIPAVLLARVISVGVPGLTFRLFGRKVEPLGGFLLLTWGGLRGAISVALALSLPAGPAKDVLLVATYTVVAFSILVQGTTMPWLLRRTLPVGERMQDAG